MKYENNTDRIKTRLLVEVTRLFMNDQLEERVDQVPVKLYPKGKNGVRCCVYRDRAVSRYWLMSIMGHRFEDETDELKSLRMYAGEAIERERPKTETLTLIGEACSACEEARHFVTNMCQGCVARSCAVNCPKDAIEIVDGQAIIDDDKCVNCGICLKACPYHAIVYSPVPCEDACPVGAISKKDDGYEIIDFDKCTFCGKCMKACPFGAIMEMSQVLDVLVQIRSGKKVTAMLAPALAGQFPVAFEKVAAAVLKLGFNQVVQVALGADMTAVSEAEEFLGKIKAGQAFMTTSCCPAYVEAVRKHLPELEPFVSDTPTPMHCTGQWVKQNDPDAVTVFIGPCVAKRHEGVHDDQVDYVLTTNELGAMFVAAGIELDELDPADFATEGSAEGKLFALSGGVSDAVKKKIGDRTNVTSAVVNGLDKKTMRLLKSYTMGKCPGNLLEVMGCEGGCVAGASNICKPEAAARKIKTYASVSR